MPNFSRTSGPGLWAARIGLLVFLVLHMYLSIRLKPGPAKARPIPYVHEETIQASLASRYMLQTGLVIFVFLLFHLAHYTFGWIGTRHAWTVNPCSYLDLHDPLNGLHDVYAMTILGFHNPLVAILYIVAQIILAHASKSWRGQRVSNPRCQQPALAAGDRVSLAGRWRWSSAWAISPSS